jgi:hypothetical protein
MEKRSRKHLTQVACTQKLSKDRSQLRLVLHQEAIAPPDVSSKVTMATQEALQKEERSKQH